MAPTAAAAVPRIGIVGAGASGLSAAHYLRQAGYDHVTVLEREPRVGGKCCSVTEGGRVHELGAVMATRDYTTTLELMAHVGSRGAPIERFHSFDPDGRPTAVIPWQQIPRLAWQVLIHYAWDTHVRYRRINAPGLAGVHADLHAPFARYAEEHHVPALPRAISPPFTAFGYGYFDEVPAAYVLKYIDMHMIEALCSPARRMQWPQGAQSLWARLADQLDVRTGAAVRRVMRSDTVRVETDTGTHEFDALILTGSLDEALHYLDATPAERSLFSAIRTYDYHVLLCRITGLPPGSGLLPAHFLAKHYGHVMLWYQRWPDQHLYTLYVLGDGTLGDHDVEATCAADLQRFGAHLDQVVATRRWRYFPHVDSTTMDAGFYEALEGMQGHNRTYYAGEIMSFSTVELCARYSRDLVARFFPTQREPVGVPQS